MQQRAVKRTPGRAVGRAGLLKQWLRAREGGAGHRQRGRGELPVGKCERRQRAQYLLKALGSANSAARAPCERTPALLECRKCARGHLERQGDTWRIGPHLNLIELRSIA